MIARPMLSIGQRNGCQAHVVHRTEKWLPGPCCPQDRNGCQAYIACICRERERVCVCACVYMYICVQGSLPNLCVLMHACVCACVRACVRVCVLLGQIIHGYHKCFTKLAQDPHSQYTHPSISQNTQTAAVQSFTTLQTVQLNITFLLKNVT